MSARALAAMVVLAALALAGRARANAAAPSFASPERAAAPLVPSPTPIAVDREHLLVRCRDEQGAPRCTFVATYALANREPVRVEVSGAFLGVEQGAVTATLGAADVRATLAPEEDARVLEAAEKLAPPRLRESDAPHTWVRQGFAFALEPGAEATLVFRGELSAIRGDNPHAYGGFTIPAHQTRHPLLGTKPRREAGYDFRYLLWPLRSWGGRRTIHLEVRHPVGWTHAPSPLLTQEAQDGGELVRTGVVDGATAEQLDLGFTFTPFPLLQGGPLLGIGGRLDLGELRLRAGWEVAGPSWIVYGLAVETDAKERFSVALTADAATPDLLVFVPSLAVGAGPIVQARPGGAAFGPRLQGTISFPFLSLVVPLDLFPGQPDPWQISMMVQASL